MESKMLWSIFVILLTLWFMGWWIGYTISGGIHVLVVIAITLLVALIIQEKKNYSYLIRCRKRSNIEKEDYHGIRQ
jgi:uncharacterized membrane protein